MSQKPPRDQTSTNDGKDDGDLSVSFRRGTPLPSRFAKVTRRRKRKDHGKHDEKTADDDGDSHDFLSNRFARLSQQFYLPKSRSFDVEQGRTGLPNG